MARDCALAQKARARSASASMGCSLMTSGLVVTATDSLVADVTDSLVLDVAVSSVTRRDDGGGGSCRERRAEAKDEHG
jgi:hypothetical protein